MVIFIVILDTPNGPKSLDQVVMNGNHQIQLNIKSLQKLKKKKKISIKCTLNFELLDYINIYIYIYIN
jgi:cell division septal protein FtsQ